MVGTRWGFFVLFVSLFLCLGAVGMGCDPTSSADDRAQIDTGDDNTASDDGTQATCDTVDCPPADEPFLEFDELSCRGIHMCKFCCQAGPCFRACEEAGSPEKTETLQAMYDCTGSVCRGACGASGSDEACTACQELECGEQMAACHWNTVGSLSCRELSDCLHGCGPLTTYGTAKTCVETGGLWCINGCFGNASPESLDKFEDYDRCTWNKCLKVCQNSSTKPEAAAKCNQCIDDNCMTELTACVEDN